MRPLPCEPALPARHRVAALLFTDIVNSTAIAAAMGNAAWAELLDEHDGRAYAAVQRFGGIVVDIAGDAVFALFDHPHDAVACAHAIHGAMRDLQLDLRAGVHVGEVGIRGHRVSGLAVHIAERIAALAHGSETLVSGAVRNAIADPGALFIDRGVHTLRGVPDPWHLFAVRTAGASIGPSERHTWPTSNPPHSAFAA